MFRIECHRQCGDGSVVNLLRHVFQEIFKVKQRFTLFGRLIFSIDERDSFLFDLDACRSYPSEAQTHFPKARVGG